MLILIYVKGQSGLNRILKHYINFFKNKNNLEQLPDGELKERIKEVFGSLRPSLYENFFRIIKIDPEDKETLDWLSNNSRQLVIAPPVVIDYDRECTTSPNRPRVYHLTEPDYDEVYLAHMLDSM